jgi:hypothetical protein
MDMEANLSLKRQRRMLLTTVFLLLPLTACGAPKMSVTLDVVFFNYLDRPIFDAFVDGKGGDSARPYPATGGSTITGVTLSTGPKKVTWRLDGPEGTPRNGETVTAKNTPVLPDVSRDARYLAVHIYPDETVELVVTRHYPRATDRGINSATKRDH